MFIDGQQVKGSLMKEKEIVVEGVRVLVWWKHIKNMNLTVKGPEGRVRISIPCCTSEKQVRLMLLARMEWIKKHQEHFLQSPAAAVLQLIPGEEHLFFGKAYPLAIVYGPGRHHVVFDAEKGIQLCVRPGTTQEKRLQVLQEWYREELLLRIPALLHYWQPRIGRQVDEWRIKRMKTRWGTCNIQRRRIWLNLELARKPEQCLEYILVHEMVHLLERGHTRQFYRHLDRLLPEWHTFDKMLQRNGEPCLLNC